MWELKETWAYCCLRAGWLLLSVSPVSRANNPPARSPSARDLPDSVQKISLAENTKDTTHHHSPPHTTTHQHWAPIITRTFLSFLRFAEYSFPFLSCLLKIENLGLLEFFELNRKQSRIWEEIHKSDFFPKLNKIQKMWWMFWAKV